MAVKLLFNVTALLSQCVISLSDFLDWKQLTLLGSKYLQRSKMCAEGIVYMRNQNMKL
jgi:hypothetical protein